MMWKTVSPMISPYSVCSTEPFELRKLKFQLAHVSCKCNLCLRNERSPLSDKLSQLRKWKDVHVQTAEESKPIPDYGLCPKCCLTMSILKEGIVKVLKDEESETHPQSTCDKAIGGNIEYFDKGCSVCSRPLCFYSNLTLDDFSSEFDLPKTCSIDHKRSRNERVKFSDSPDTKSEEVASTFPYTGNLTCLDAFIDSIRPPLAASEIYKINRTFSGLPLGM